MSDYFRALDMTDCQRLIENINDALIIDDREGKVVYVNDCCLTLFGYGRDEISGMRYEALFIPEQRTAMRDRHMRLMAGEERADQFESQAVRKNGGRVWIAVRIATIMQGGQVVGSQSIMRDITEFRRANEALRESEKRYRLLAENASDVIWTMDLHGRRTYISPAISRLRGLTVEEALAEPVENAFAAPLAVADKEKIMLLRDGKAFSGLRFEMSVLHKNGSTLWVEVNASSLQNEHGDVVGILGVSRDITERKRAEKTQKALLQISDAAQSADDMGDLYRRLHATVATLLPAENLFVALYDEESDVVSFPYFIDKYDSPPPAQSLGNITLTAEVLRSGQALLVTAKMFEVRKKMGVEVAGTVPVAWLGVPLVAGGCTIGALVVQGYSDAVRFNEHDKVLLQFVSSQIATAISRKRSVESLEESHAIIGNLESALNEHSIVLVFDNQHRVLSVNDLFCAALGYRRADVIGRHIAMFSSGKHSATFLESVWATLSSGRVWQGELADRARDGSLIWFDSTIVPFLDAAGSPYQYVAIRTDISERKRAEDWQRHYARTLGLITAEAPLTQVLRGIGSFAERQSPGARCVITLRDGMHVTTVRAGKTLVMANQTGTTIVTDADDAGREVEVLGDLGDCDALAAVLLEGASNAEVSASYVKHELFPYLEPIIAADKEPLGMLMLYHERQPEVKPEDRVLLNQSAALAALAIERVRHQSEQRLAKVVFESSVEAVIVSDQHDRIVMVNPAFEKLTGYCAADVVGKDPSLLESGHHQLDFYQRIEDSVAREDWWQGEFWCRHRAGDSRPMLLSVVAVRDASGEVSQRIRVMSDISEQKFQAARIEQLAFYDSLTGLPNRALFLDRLEHSLDAARRHGLKGALLFLDLDRFKEINDSLGHGAGDEVLVEVARRFQTMVRKEETLARLGGDEFVLIAENANQATAAAIAERLLGTLNDPLVLQEQSIKLAASIGVALYPDDGDTVGDLIKHADIAMYRAKAMGGGFRFYQAAMGAALQERLGLAHRLELAIEQGQLQLHYQPRVALASHAMQGAEALLRWDDAELGSVSPAQFIPIAEERGLIGALGDWVIAEACRQMAQWQQQGLSFPGTMAVNLSALQLHLPDMVDKLLARIDSASLTPDRFEIELTESSMMADPAAAIAILDQLHGEGFSLAIDDFGTGYSSLVYLKRFAVDNIKIDMSFVSDMLTDRNDAAIVATIVAMSRSLGLRTTAEGVESAEQAEALLQLGCDFAQGYYFGRPEPADVFARRWLKPVAEKTSGAL